MAMLAAPDEGAPAAARHVHAHDRRRPAGAWVIDLDRPVAENVQKVAESFGRQPLDITALCSTGLATTI